MYRPKFEVRSIPVPEIIGVLKNCVRLSVCLSVRPSVTLEDQDRRSENLKTNCTDN